MTTRTEFDQAEDEYNAILNQLLATGSARTKKLTIDLDGAVGAYVVRAIEKGVKDSLAGRGWIVNDAGASSVPDGDTFTVQELAEPYGLGARLFVDIDRRRVAVREAEYENGAIRLLLEDEGDRLPQRVTRIERRLDGMAKRIRTQSLDIVDDAGRSHVAAYAGDGFGSLWVSSRCYTEPDNGASVVITASEEDPEEPFAYVVAKLGQTDRVVGAIGTEHPYGQPLP